MTPAPEGRSAPTLEDVAARAGVSRATASRVVNGEARVAAATRAAVEAAADELGYVPNQAARSLAAHRNDTIALVVCEPSGQIFGDPFFGRVVRGAAAELGPTRYQFVLLMVQDDADRARADRHLVRGNADGVLLVSTRQDDPLPGRVAAAGVPCVLAGRPPEGVAVGYVDADNVGGAHRATTHLLERGRRVVATVAGPADMAAGVDRLVGWRKALAEAGLPRLAGPWWPGRPSPARAASTPPTELLARPPRPRRAVRGLRPHGARRPRRLAAGGRRVPDDVAVVGFDDSDLARGALPPLTTVRQPIEGLGHAMAASLLSLLDASSAPTPAPSPSSAPPPVPPPPAIVLPTDLVIRASS